MWWLPLFSSIVFRFLDSVRLLPIYSLNIRLQFATTPGMWLGDEKQSRAVFYLLIIKKILGHFGVRAIHYYPFRLLIGLVFGFVKIVASHSSGRSQQSKTIAQRTDCCDVSRTASQAYSVVYVRWLPWWHPAAFVVVDSGSSGRKRSINRRSWVWEVLTFHDSPVGRSVCNAFATGF